MYEGAGIAGLVKAALELKHKKLPPSINFSKANTKINFAESAVYVNTALCEWEPAAGIRRCGVSAFGFSGTNCHVVLEEAPKRTYGSRDNRQVPQIFTLSAANPAVLTAMAGNFCSFLEEENYSLEEICCIANTGRGHYNCRFALVVLSKQELHEKLHKVRQYGFEAAEVFYGCHKLVSNTLKNRGGEEITSAEKQELTWKANQLLSGLKEGNNAAVLSEICLLYIKGADIEWNAIYAGLALAKISLPGYLFEQKRCWLEVAGRKQPCIFRPAKAIW